MELEIYDGQYAAEICPNIKSEEDINIKRFYNEKLGIYIKRTGNITIYCKIHAYGIPDKLKGYYIKYSNRVDPFYVVHSGKYVQDSFANFKKETEKILYDLGFKIVFTEETDNIIFKNVEKFDSIYTAPNNPLSPKDFNDITYLIKDRERLEFKAGKIDDIAAFCREILKSDINDITIAVFTGEMLTNEGNVNIFLDKNPEMSFVPTDKTKKILEDSKKKSEKNRKDETKRRANEEITQGISIIIQGINKINNAIDGMNNAGCSKSEIEEIVKPKYKSLDKLLQSGQKPGIDTTMAMAAILTALMAGIVIGMIAQPYLSGNFLKGSSVDRGEGVPTVTPIVTPTVIQTAMPTITVVPTSGIISIVTPVPNDTVSSIPNETNKTNGTNTTNGTNKTRTNKTNGINNS